MILARLAVIGLVAAIVSPAAAESLHQDWTALLQRFVNAEGRVDYVGLDAAAGSPLEPYIRRLAVWGPRSRPGDFPSDDHRLAYYLNAYNAQTFRGVLLLGDPCDAGVSPRQSGAGAGVWRGLVPGLDFFGRYKFWIDRRRINLKRLEDADVRAGFGDPRIHAALNCASLGCPRLPRVAFEPYALQRQLDAAMSEFATAPRHARLDEERQVVVLSEIFRWFERDFVTWLSAHPTARTAGSRFVPWTVEEAADASTRPAGHPFSTRRSVLAQPGRALDVRVYVNLYRPASSALPLDLPITHAPYDRRLNAVCPERN